MRQLDHFVIDEADQLLLPHADQRPKSLKPGARFRAMEFFGGLGDLTQYFLFNTFSFEIYKVMFRAQKQSLENFKRDFAFEDALTAILYEANLLQFENDELVFKKNRSTAQARDR